jgi:aminoglycoside phosphotransferase (APT) family kinase protein
VTDADPEQEAEVGLELIAEGRLGQVYAYGDGRVLKLDRPDWNGVAPFEAEVLGRLAAAGLPVPRAHGTVTVDGRTGVVLDRVDGRSLMWELREATPEAAEAMAEPFGALHLEINGAVVGGLPELVPRLRSELEQAVADPGLQGELTDLLAGLDDRTRGVCHWDFHPDNVLAGPEGWVVIDWLTVATGPPVADFARTLVIWGLSTWDPAQAFMRALRRVELELRGADAERVDAWTRVVAAARLAEGFSGEEADWLSGVARGEVRLFS